MEKHSCLNHPSKTITLRITFSTISTLWQQDDGRSTHAHLSVCFGFALNSPPPPPQNWWHLFCLVSSACSNNLAPPNNHPPTHPLRKRVSAWHHRMSKHALTHTHIKQQQHKIKNKDGARCQMGWRDGTNTNVFVWAGVATERYAGHMFCGSSTWEHSLSKNSYSKKTWVIWRFSVKWHFPGKFTGFVSIGLFCMSKWIEKRFKNIFFC